MPSNHPLSDDGADSPVYAASPSSSPASTKPHAAQQQQQQPPLPPMGLGGLSGTEMEKAQARVALASAQAKVDGLVAKNESFGPAWEEAKAQRDALQARLQLLSADAPPPPPPPAPPSALEERLAAAGVAAVDMPSVLRLLASKGFISVESLARLQEADVGAIASAYRAALLGIRDAVIKQTPQLASGTPGAGSGRTPKATRRKRTSGKGDEDDSDSKKPRGGEGADAAAAGADGGDDKPASNKKKKSEGQESKSQRTVYMRMKWPAFSFARDCTFASVTRKQEAKVIWDSVKATLKAPTKLEDVVCVVFGHAGVQTNTRRTRFVRQALIDKGLTELEESKGYSWDEHHKAWQLKIWVRLVFCDEWPAANAPRCSLAVSWCILATYVARRRVRTNKQQLKNEALAAGAGKALLKKRATLQKTDNFRAVGQPIFADFKQQDGSSSGAPVPLSPSVPAPPPPPPSVAPAPAYAAPV